MPVPHIMAIIDKIQVGVDVHDADRFLIIECPNAGDMDGMISGDH